MFVFSINAVHPKTRKILQLLHLRQVAYQIFSKTKRNMGFENKFPFFPVYEANFPLGCEMCFKISDWNNLTLLIFYYSGSFSWEGCCKSGNQHCKLFVCNIKILALHFTSTWLSIDIRFDCMLINVAGMLLIWFLLTRKMVTSTNISVWLQTSEEVGGCKCAYSLILSLGYTYFHMFLFGTCHSCLLRLKKKNLVCLISSLIINVEVHC